MSFNDKEFKKQQQTIAKHYVKCSTCKYWIAYISKNGTGNCTLHKKETINTYLCIDYENKNNSLQR